MASEAIKAAKFYVASAEKGVASTSQTLKAAESQVRLAEKMLESAKSQELSAQSQLSSSEKELQEAREYLKSMEKKWQVIDIDLDSSDSEGEGEYGDGGGKGLEKRATNMENSDKNGDGNAEGDDRKRQADNNRENNGRKRRARNGREGANILIPTSDNSGKGRNGRASWQGLISSSAGVNTAPSSTNNDRVRGQTVQIFVFTDIIIPLDVKSSDTIQSVKAKVYAREQGGAPLSETEIWYAGNHLKDGKTLSDYNIEEGFALDYLWRTNGLIQPFFGRRRSRQISSSAGVITALTSTNNVRVRGQTMQIFVLGYRNFTLDVKSSHTIQSVRAKIYTKQQGGRPLSEMELYCEGKLLEDGKTLSDYNIGGKSEIHSFATHYGRSISG